MNRILIYTDILSSGEYDVFNSTDYNRLCGYIPVIYSGMCPNVGNRLWFQGIISEISTPENEIEYYSNDMSADFINCSYNMIIAPMANVFSAGYKSLMQKLGDFFDKLTIPVYVIACGVQADSYDSLNQICSDIRPEATHLIKSVYKSGGEFALRGYFTKEFFNKLGFGSAVVTGCPSLYQLGRENPIKDCGTKVQAEAFRPALNGNLNQSIPYLKKYPNSTFFDQNNYFSLLYDSSFLSDNTAADANRLIKSIGLEPLKALLNGKVRLIADMAEWSEYLKNEGFNFSFGSRIHGNIMSLLSGIPAVINACDSRTREMAEFFELPIANGKITDLYSLYTNADFSRFTSSFSKKFDAFEAFLKSKGIVTEINCENRFFAPFEGGGYRPALNSSKHRELNSHILQNNSKLMAFDRFITLSRKLRGIN